MTSRREYDVVAPLALFQTLRTLSGSQRRGIEDFVARLARQPGTPGDFEAPAEDGRIHQAKVVGRWLISYWIVDGSREVRLSSLELIE